MFTLDDLKNKLQEINAMGYVLTHRSGPTGIGKTLEDLLDIAENNIAGADFQRLGELKSCRNNQTSMVTLFTKSPEPRAVNGRLLKAYGYIDPSRPTNKVLHTTVDGARYNTLRGSNGFKVEVINNALHLLSNFPEQIEVYWRMDVLRQSFENKLPSLIFVKADSRGVGREEEFHYVEAYHLQGFSFSNFKQLIKDGIIKIDIRIGQYPDGRVHDHGTAFRIANNMIDSLFDRRIKLL